MTTQYTPILKLALPVQGELSGTWGDVVNDNITSMLEEAIAGRSVINSWTTNAHTLSEADGTTAEARAAMLEFTDTGAALTGAATVTCPSTSKIYVCKNDSGQQVTITTAAGTGVDIPDGKTMIVFCDGTNVEEVVTNINTLSYQGYTVDFGGAFTTAAAFTTSGAYSLTLTATGATNVTLPTTGTLATLDGTETFTNKTFTSPTISSPTMTGSISAADLTISGNTTIGDEVTDTLTITGTITSDMLFTDDTYDIGKSGATRPRHVYISQTLTAGGNTSLGGTLGVTGDVAVNTNKFNVTAASGNTSIAGTLAVTGTSTLTGNATFSGQVITDTINENTSTAGVTIDGVVLKDGGATVTADVNFGDDDKAIFGAGSDLQIYHDGSNSYIHDNGTGQLILRGSNGVILNNADNSKNLIVANDGGEVSLFHNGAAKLATTTTGIDVTGTVTADGLTVDGATVLRNTDYSNALKINRNLDVSSVGAAGTQIGFGAIYNGSDVYPVSVAAAVDTDGTAYNYTVSLDGNSPFVINPSELVVNEDGRDFGFRVESDNLSHAFVVDGEYGHVSIGGSEHIRQFNVVSTETAFLSGNNDFFLNFSDGSGNNGYLKNLHIRGLGSAGSATENLNAINLNADYVKIVDGYLRADKGIFTITSNQQTGVSGNYFKLGTIYIHSSQSAEITIHGTTTYSTGYPCSGKTTLMLRGDNDTTTLAGNWWSESGGYKHLSDIRYKQTGTANQFDIWVRPIGTFTGLDVSVVTGGIWTSDVTDTGSTTAPTGSTAFDAKVYTSLGANSAFVLSTGEAVFNEDQIDRDFRVESDTDNYALFLDGATSNFGIGTSNPDAKLTVKDTITFLRDTTYHGEEPAAKLHVEQGDGWSDGSSLVFSVHNGDNADSGTYTERMRINSGGSIRMGTYTSADTNMRHQLNGGPFMIRDITSGGSEASDWPIPSLNIRSYDSFSANTMLSFMLRNDTAYTTTNELWNFRLYHDEAEDTTDNTVALALKGPGSLYLGGGDTKQIMLNADSLNTDTVVRSDNYIYMIHVDAGKDCVGLGGGSNGVHDGSWVHINTPDQNWALNQANPYGAALTISNSDTNYGMMFAVGTDGNGYIQQRRTDATDAYYDLCLQRYGGSVNIGSSGSIYSGKLSVSGESTFYSSSGAGIVKVIGAGSTYGGGRVLEVGVEATNDVNLVGFIGAKGTSNTVLGEIQQFDSGTQVRYRAGDTWLHNNGIHLVRHKTYVPTGNFTSGTTYDVFDTQTDDIDTGIYVIEYRANAYNAGVSHYTVNVVSVPFYINNTGTNDGDTTALPLLQGTWHANNNTLPTIVFQVEYSGYTTIRWIPQVNYTGLDSNTGGTRYVMFSLYKIG